MSIDFDSFLRWAEDRLGDVQVNGREIKVNSIFAEDTKHHMWCSPSGGKYERDDGVYRCFYTENKGTLIGLVMQIDGCTYEEAKEILSGHTPISILEEELDQFFKNKEEATEKPDPKILQLPTDTHYIANLPEGRWRTKVIDYLKSRKIPYEGLMFCMADAKIIISADEEQDYRYRILIPYYDRQGKLIYFNTRSMTDKGLRYMGPPKSTGVGKSDVLYAPKWPKAGSKVYLTEGELDALSLCLCGFNGMACGGKVLDDKQINMIREYDICLAGDQDGAGYAALLMMGNKLLANQFRNVSYIRPPQGIKDWNKMLVTFKPEIVQGWIAKHEKPFDEWTENYLETMR